MTQPAPFVSAYTADDDLVALRNALLNMPIRALPTAVPAVSSKLLTVAAIVTGMSFRETAGAAAVFELFDGGDANGALIATQGLAANGSLQVAQGVEGVLAQQGIFLNVVSGTVKGVVWARYGGHDI